MLWEDAKEGRRLAISTLPSQFLLSQVLFTASSEETAASIAIINIFWCLFRLPRFQNNYDAGTGDGLEAQKLWEEELGDWVDSHETLQPETCSR